MNLGTSMGLFLSNQAKEETMPETVKVREERKEGARSIDVTYEFGSTLEEMIESFGPDKVYSAALETFKADLRNMVRARLKAKEEDEEIHEAVTAWTPGARSGNPNVARIHRLLDKLPGAEQKAIRERLGSLAE